MVIVPLIFSVAFCLACAVSVFLGAYSLYLNPRSPLNRSLAAMLFALTLWTVGLGIALSAPDLQTCLFWRRFAALGWGSFFSLLLHFALILTGREKLLRKWWAYVLLYLPPALILTAFTWFPGVNPGQYRMVPTGFGWVNVAVNNGWDWFHMAYFIGFSLLAFGLVWHWGRRSNDPHARKISRLVLLSFIPAMLVGSVTDIFFNSLFSDPLPQIAPIMIMFPLSVIYYAIRRYRFMDPRPESNDDFLITDQIRTRIYNYFSLALIAGGLLNFISQYLFHDKPDLVSVMLFSAGLLGMGLVFFIVQRLKITRKAKDIFNTIAVSIFIPVITLRFVEYASLTVWAFPFILLVISLIFNKRYILVAVAASIFLTQVAVWVIVPKLSVVVDDTDYIVRIGLFAIAFWLAFYVNRVYISRLRENETQIASQKLVYEISADFITATPENLDDKTHKMLRGIGEYFGADQAYILSFDTEKQWMMATHCWHRDPSVSEAFIKIPVGQFPWLLEQFMAHQVVHIPDVEKLPQCVGIQLAMMQVRSMLRVPVPGRGPVLRYLSLDSATRPAKWQESRISLLGVIAHIWADADANVEHEKEINHMAYYDHLTGLPNRSLFDDRVKQAIHLASRTGRPIAVMFLDLDSFKSVNDTMGHEAGDSLLVHVADKLKSSLRRSDTVSRFGGDEFLIMLQNIESVGDILPIAAQIMGMFDRPFEMNGQELFLTASAGISVYPVDGDDTDILVKNADIAMYTAKARGRNQYVLCSPDMKQEVHTRMRLTNDMYRALERNEFEVFYQPQICLHTKRIIGLEALLRWRHPALGMVPPGRFIPLAEHSGLINSIGEWVLKAACEQNKAWQDAGLAPVRVAVNVSVSQLRDTYLVSRVGAVLAETGLPSQYLELEVTESAAVTESEYVIHVLDGLKGLGVSISIDDFGTGYSSLGRLKALPVDRLKMDMQFVHGIGAGEKDEAVTKAVIALARNLGLRVIAEGVETAEQLAFLSDWQCDEVQGYYYYKPMPAREVEKVLERQCADSPAAR